MKPFINALAIIWSILFPSAAPVLAQVNVVASFSILADMTREIGGDRVSVTSLVGPNSDAHAFQPTPDDARRIAHANLVVVNGLGFEGWLNRLVRASGTRASVITASTGIEVLLMEEEEEHKAAERMRRKVIKPAKVDDPHAWQSLANGRVYATNIAKALIELDPPNATHYRQRLDAYLSELTALDEWVRRELSRIPAEHRKVITSHDAFRYFGRTYGIAFLAPQGVSTDSEPSSGDIANLIQQIRRNDIKAIFIENISDRRIIDQLTRETGTTVGGTLYSDALSAANGPAATYIAMFRHNVALIVSAIRKN
ncbi:MAG: metal ABC transporter substrate-binding protein [Alphaproteobacteria bacterium]|nr:metal ABC transporter substrate-binding protein [Alphaproteobacteria bacterium]